MSFDLATAGASLEARLRAALPGWGIRNAETGAKAFSLGVLLSYVQLDISTDFDGQRLAPNHVAVDFQLDLSAPETDPAKGTARLNTALPELCRALDAEDDILWTRATKGRDNAGTFYGFPLTIFCNYPAPEDGDDTEE